MQWTVERLVEATQGRLINGSRELRVGRISTDTRNLQPGDCFLALSGERFDGHDFIPAALEKGAHAFIISSSRKIPVLQAAGIAVIGVSDTLFALGEIARHHRNQYSIPVAGVTGSNGKTSTKEILASILAQKHSVLKNQGNFNNLIGVPLTLLSLDSHHETAVVEMGINIPGEMARLCEISNPTVGIITNIHPAHLEGLGSLDRILEEKSRLWEALPADGTAVVNLDDPRLAKRSESLKCRRITFSVRDRAADVGVSGAIEFGMKSTDFRIRLGSDTVVPVSLPVPGDHQVRNALAASAAAWAMGESTEAIALGVSACRPMGRRMQIRQLDDGRVILDDTYNANPESVLAAVRAALKVSHGGIVLAVLGEMKELGPESATLHRDLGREIGSLGLAGLITVGDLAREIVEGAREAGMDHSGCRHAKSREQAIAWLRERKIEHSWILVKGSRAMAMERIVEGILDE